MVTKETTFEDIERFFPLTDAVFKELGMGHVGTQQAYFDTVGESAIAHGFDPQYVVDAINKVYQNKY